MTAFATFGADLRFTFRLFRKSPGFSAIAIISLALGIGASSAIFSLIYAVLLDPYPYRNADRILSLTFTDRHAPSGPKARLDRIDFTVPDFLEIRRGSRTLEDEMLVQPEPFIATGGIPEQVRGAAFSPNAFEFMGVPALLGRTFTPADIPSPQTPPRLAVLSYLFWQRHFNRDPQVIGKSLELDHQPWTVIGVLPPRFTWGDQDVYVPLAMTPDPNRTYHMNARIKPGVKLGAVNAELQSMTERFRARNPAAYPKEFRFHVQRLNDALLGRFEGVLVILLAGVGFLLLIACGNVSILLLARAASRQKEIAVRVALGAVRRRVIRQLLTEAVVLSLAGGLFGVALAYAGVPLIVRLMPQYSVPHEAVIHVNGPVVLFTFTIAVLTGILFGMAPAFQLARTDVRDAMQDAGRGFSGSRRAGATRSALVVLEVALTLVLLAGAGIAIHGLIALTSTELGFNPSNVLTAVLELLANSWNTWQARTEHLNRILRRLGSTPGVASVSATLTAVPPYVGFDGPFQIPGRAAEGPDRKTRIGLVSSGYFSTLRVPLLRGRMFSASETTRARRVGVINEEMARRYWPGGDPIGVKIRIPVLDFKADPEVLKPPDAGEPIEIIGVVATMRNQGLAAPAEPAIYVPWSVLSAPAGFFLIRTAGDPHRMETAVRSAVRAEDPDQPIHDLMTLEERLRFETAYPRFSTTLFAVFAGVALLLAASGLYSVVSYAVAHRMHEFGVRMALGARARDVLRLVALATLRLMIAGLALGLAGTLALRRIIASYVSGWNPDDPLAFAAVIATLLATAFLASFLPARRAISVQPMAALRHE